MSQLPNGSYRNVCIWLYKRLIETNALMFKHVLLSLNSCSPPFINVAPTIGDFLNICYKDWNIFSCHFEEYCGFKVPHFQVCISLIATGANSFE